MRFFFILTVFLFGCEHSRHQNPTLLDDLVVVDHGGSWSEPNDVEMKFEVIGNPKKMEDIRLLGTFKNKSKENLVIDKEMIVGFGLGFKTDLSEEYFSSEAKDVVFKDVKKLEKPGKEDYKTRFVTLRPGEEIIKIFGLFGESKGVRQGHASDMNMVHYGFFYEVIGRYSIPEKVREIKVDLWYKGVWMMAENEFKEWNGVSVRDLGLWQGRAKSNQISIVRNKNSSFATPSQADLLRNNDSSVTSSSQSHFLFP